MKQVQKGFTLIELMIVVAIIGILAAIALPQYQTYIAKSQVSRVMAEAGAVKTAVEVCVNEGRTAGVGVPTAAAPNLCDPQATASTLMTGATQGSCTITAGTNGCPTAAITAATGVATIIGTFGNAASTRLTAAGQNTLTWSRDASGTWTCASTTPNLYRPRGC